jgi:integrase
MQKAQRMLLRLTDSDGVYAEFWRQLGGFINQKDHADTIQLVLSEWLKFLNCNSLGTPRAYHLMCSASLEQALDFKAMLEDKRGQKSYVVNHPKPLTYASATIWKRIILLRHIYRFLMNQGFCDYNPFLAVKLPPKRALQKRPTNAITSSDVMKMIDVCNNDFERAVMASLFGAGLRRSECVNLLMSDFIERDGYSYFFLRDTKTNQDYMQQISDQMVPYIKHWFMIRKMEKAQFNESIWIYKRRGGSTLTGSGIYKMFRRIAKAAGVSVRVSPHSARATSITTLYMMEVPERKIQRWSRHVCRESTERYDKTHLLGDDSPAKKLEY